MSNDKTKDICESIKNDSIERLKDLLDYFENISEPIFQIEKPDFRIHSKRDPSSKDDFKDLLYGKITIVHYAAYFNSLDVLKYLEKEKNLSLRIKSELGYLPLHYACMNGSYEVSHYILEKDPDQAKLQFENKNLLSFLYLSVCGERQEIFEELLSHGATASDATQEPEEIIRKAIGQRNANLLSVVCETFKANLQQPCANKASYSMEAVIRHVPQAFEFLYRGKEDILYHYYDRTGFHSLISLIAQVSYGREFEPILLRILSDVKKYDISIEPPVRKGINESGVCHWACMYCDVEVARAMLSTKDVLINRFDSEGKTGAALLVERKEAKKELLKILMEFGFDVNARLNENRPTLLECFTNAISPNYEVIRFLIEYGADVNAKHTRSNMTLYDFVKSRRDRKMKEAFGIPE